jgi:nucleoside-diphosphate-sugar epimerase
MDSMPSPKPIHPASSGGGPEVTSAAETTVSVAGADTVPVWIVGMGYVGDALAQALDLQGVAWRGVRRRPSADARLVPLDLDHAGTPAYHTCLTALGSCRQVIYLAPPPKTGPGDPRLRAFLQALDAQPPQRFVYVSTTGVYGNQEGSVVTEASPLRAATARALRRLDAETALAEAVARWSSCEWVILRLPGIYGPGRFREEAIRAGLQVPCPEICPPGNRIHRDDIVEVLWRLLQPGAPQGIFNVADAEHMSSTDFALAVARQIGVALPPCIEDLETYYAANPGMASFLREQRCVDSGRIRQALQWSPTYDTAHAGIAASLGNPSTLNREWP